MNSYDFGTANITRLKNVIKNLKAHALTIVKARGSSLKTRLKRIEGIFDKKVYHSILVPRALPEGKKLLGKGFFSRRQRSKTFLSFLSELFGQKREKR